MRHTNCDQPRNNSGHFQFRTLKIPEKSHPMVRFLLEEMNRRRISMTALQHMSGVSIGAISGWRTEATPAVHNLEACLNALGFSLKVVRLEDDGED